MKFSIKRSLLLSNLVHVTRAVSTKPQMPILTGVKIEVNQKYITLTSSNGEISIQAKIQTSSDLVILEQGVVVLPGKYLLEIIRKVDAEMIYFIRFEENVVKILADRSNFSLNTLDTDAYPLISFNNNDHMVVLDVLNLKQIIKKTTFAASLSEARMVLTGVNLDLTDNKLLAVATDSFRLAQKFIVMDKTPNIKVVIPSHNLDELNKIIEDIEENVEIHFSKTKVLFKYKNILFQTRLIEGVFPNTSSLIPTNFLTEITFHKQEIIAAIERASLFTSGEATNIIKLTLNEKGIVEIYSTHNEIGAVLEEVHPIKCSSIIPFQIAFSAKFFLEAIRAFDSPEITVHFTGEIKPFIITGEYDVNHLQLILPVRVA
ncbi:MAG TPA: DNA polymerase III subunit beta [Acholeplasmataceae bacterium]|nr:DNA polymerase III subunit beta [Acholeplasmataceae bacterium]